MSDDMAFLEALYSVATPGSFINISGYTMNGGKKYAVDEHGKPIWTDKIAAVAVENIASLSVDAFDRWFTVHPRTEPRRGAEDNTAEVLAVPIDFDFADSSDGKNPERSFTSLEDVKEFCHSHIPVAPSALILSGHGVHAYWFLAEPSEPVDGKELLARFDSFVRTQANSVGKDLDAVRDLPRVLRLPGSVNWKNPKEPKTITVAELHTDRRYGTDDFGFCPDVQVSDLNPDTSNVTDQAVTEWIKNRQADNFGGERIDRWVTAMRKAKEGDPDNGRHGTAMKILGWLTTDAETGLVNFNAAVTAVGNEFTNRFTNKAAARKDFAAMTVRTVKYRIAEPQTAVTYTEPGNTVTTEPFPSGLRFTDTDNAERLVHLHGDNIRYVAPWRTWLIWDGNRWRGDPEGVRSTELAKDVSRRLFRELSELTVNDSNKQLRDSHTSWARQSASGNRLTAMVKLARGIPGNLIEPEELDADPWALGVANGWIDLRTGTHHPPDPAKLMTVHSPIRWDPDATAPTWEHALADWLPDTETRNYFQRLCGQAVVGTVRDHILVILYGNGGNGKSTAVGALAHILGDYFVTPHKSLLTRQKREQHATVKASLFRVRLAVAAESDRQKLEEASVKELTGGELIRARWMNQDEFSFTPTHSMWLQTNDLPEVEGTSEGTWRRLKVVGFHQQFAGDKKDTELPEKLQGEAPGILNWLIDGALEWQTDGIEILPQAVATETANYRQQEDTVARFLEDTGYELHPNGQTGATRLQEKWGRWTENNTDSRRSGNELAKWLRNHGCKSKSKRTQVIGNRTQTTTWHGLKDPDSPMLTTERPDPL